MFCKECGEKIAKSSKFCRFCGTQVEQIDEENKEEIDTKEQEAEKLEEKVEEKKDIELTDNIDVTKIVLDINKEEKEPEKEKSKTQDFEDVLNDINNSIDKMNDEIPSPGETQSAKDKSLDPSKEIKNILDEFESDEKNNNDEEKENTEEPLNEEPVVEDKEEIELKEEEKEDTQPKEELEETTVEKELNEETPNLEDDLEKTSVIVNEEIIKIPDTTFLSETEQNTDKVENDIQPEKKESKHIVLPIILTLLLLVSVGGVIYLYMMFAKEHDKVNSLENNKKELQEKIKENENVKPVEEKMTYYLEGYEISLPNVKEVSYTNNSLLVNVDDSNIYTYIKKNVKYSDIKSSMWKNKSIIEDAEYKVSKYGTKVVDSREYVVYQIAGSKGNKYIVAYTDIDGKATAAFVINNKDNNTEGKELTTANNIVDSLKENKEIVNSQIKIFSE